MFRYAHSVYTVYSERSFTKAAAKLFVSQPSLSATIKKAEQVLKITIFDRSTPVLSLTQEGEAYIEAVEKLIAIENEFHNKIMDIANLNTGTLTVSGANFISSFILSKIIEKFSAKYPGISINLIESNSTELETILLTDKADMLFDYHYDNKLICGELLLTETIILAVPASFEINKSLKKYALSPHDFYNHTYLNASCPAVNLDVFKNDKFLFLKPGNNMHMQAVNLCNEFNFKPHISMYLDQLMTSYNMCSLGMGIVFVTDTLITSVAGNDNIRFYKINSSHINRPLYIEYKKNKYLNGAMKKFMAIAKESYARSPQE